MSKSVKFLSVALFALLLIGGAVQAAKVSSIPAPGIKQFGALTAQYGKLGFDDNGNVYRLVYNNSTRAGNRGYSAWYVATAGNSYTVKSSYEATSDLANWAGIWYCDADGNEAITASEYGWVQIGGHAVASVEGTVAVVVGDLLIGTAGHQYLIKGRAALTALTTATTTEAYLTIPGPYATTAFSTAAAGTAEVFIRSLM